jgi:hypothetical protein
MKTGAPKVQMGFNLFESTSEGNKAIPMKLEILQGQSPIRANDVISCQMSAGAEVHSEKMPYLEPRPESRAGRPRVNGKDMKSDPRQDDVSAGFFKDQKSGRQGHRQPLQQDTTCEGVRPYNTFRPGYSEVRSL